jgi:hypothetical protein
VDRDALDRLRLAIPVSSDTATILGVQEGVLLADDALKNTPFLSNAIGLDMRGLIRRAGVIFRLEDLCKRGDLPFQSQITKMPFGSWHWLELKAAGVRAHVCRTDEAEAFPADTPNKQDARLVNPQGDLFKPRPVPLAEILPTVEEMYAWLTYGAAQDGKLAHLCWGVPACDENSWLAHLNILRGGAAIGAPVPPPPSSPDPKTKLRFLEHIEEALQKKDDGKQA